MAVSAKADAAVRFLDSPPIIFGRSLQLDDAVLLDEVQGNFGIPLDRCVVSVAATDGAICALLVTEVF